MNFPGVLKVYQSLFLDFEDENEISDDQEAGSNIRHFFLQQFGVLKGQTYVSKVFLHP